MSAWFQCQRGFSVSVSAVSVSALFQCQRCPSVSVVSVSALFQCQRCFSICVVPVSAWFQCQRGVSVSVVSVSALRQGQRCSSVSVVFREFSQLFSFSSDRYVILKLCQQVNEQRKETRLGERNQ